MSFSAFRRLMLVSVLIALATVAEKPHAGTKPNILVILTDDLEMGTFNTMLSAGLLPNIKQRLVDQGFVFDNSFVTDSLCCPSRATFLTGQYPHNHNVRSNGLPKGGVALFRDGSSLATWLQAAGCRTGLIGKYLNGYGSLGPLAPATSPFNPAYVPPGWSSWQAFIDPGAYTAYDYTVSDNGVVTDHRQFGEQPWNYHTDMITLRGLAFINDALVNHAGQPFFLVQTPMSPHFHKIDRDHPTLYNECPAAGGQQAPVNSGNLFGSTLRPAPRHTNTVFGKIAQFPLPQPPNFNEADVSDKPTWIRNRKLLDATDVDCLQKQYWRRIEAMRAADDMVGIDLAFLDAKGATANTIVIFTSDNGYMKGEHRLTEKEVPYEESIRVPLVIRVPWDLTGHHISQMVVSNDWAPTIVGLAGATPTLAVDGRSLVPVLHGQNALARNAFIIEQGDGCLDTSPCTPTYLGDYPVLESPYFGVRLANPPRLYVLYNSGSREYYDLDLDPYELTNLTNDAARQAEIQQLNSLMNAMKTCAGAVCSIYETFFTLTR